LAWELHDKDPTMVRVDWNSQTWVSSHIHDLLFPTG
jgi:hypothetical protein